MEGLNLSVTIRGLGLESFSRPLTSRFARSRGISMAMAGNSINNSRNSSGMHRGNARNNNFRSEQRRGLQTLITVHSPFRSPSRWDLPNSARVMSNQVHLRRLTQIERHLNAKTWTASRSISINAASGGSPPPESESFIGKLIERIIQFIVALLPSKALVEQVEEKVDEVAAMVKQGAKIVVEVADGVEEVANIAEMKAEELEKLAHKVEQITEEVQKVVDDVANVLEGEKGSSSLVDTIQNLKKDAAAAKSAASAAAATAKTNAGAANVQNLKTNTLSGAVDSGAATTTNTTTAVGD